MIVTTLPSSTSRRCGIAAFVSHQVPNTLTSKVFSKISSVKCVEVAVVDAGGPAGVVDQDVEAAVALDDRVDQRPALFAVADVGLEVRGVPAELTGDPLSGLDR